MYTGLQNIRTSELQMLSAAILAECAELSKMRHKVEQEIKSRNEPVRPERTGGEVVIGYHTFRPQPGESIPVK